MKKKYIYSLLIVLLLLIVTGCSNSIQANQDNKENNSVIEKEESKENSVNEIESEVSNMNNVVLKINNVEYKLELENNDTVNDLLNNIPLSLSMNELNGNEYYVYLDFNLKSNSENVKNIKAGDVMLFGNNCLVIFYETFNTSYNYTRIGHIDNIDSLKDNLKSGKVELKAK